MTLARLKWLTVAIPTLFVAVLSYVRQGVFGLHQPEPLLDSLFAASMALIGAGVLSHFVFGRVESMARSLLEQEAEERALSEVGREISALLNIDSILTSVVEKTRQLLHTEVAAIALVDQSSHDIYMRATSGIRTDAFRRIRLLPGQGLAGRVVQTGEPHRLHDYLSDASIAHEQELDAVVAKEGLRSHLAVPLRAGDEILGALYAARRSVSDFTPHQADLLERLGNQAAIAIVNARLYDQVRHLAVLEERDRLAREMHDGLAQALAHLHIRVQALKELLNAGRLAQAKAQLARMELLMDDAYTEVRSSILGLRTAHSLGSNLVPYLNEYLLRWSEEDGVRAELQVAGSDQPELPPAVEVQAVRIIQEALANVRRHAEARHAAVTFSVEGDWARVVVEDDGKGFDPASVTKAGGRHLGLDTMRERAESVGGKLQVSSSPGQGTRVVVDLPLK